VARRGPSGEAGALWRRTPRIPWGEFRDTVGRVGVERNGVSGKNIGVRKAGEKSGALPSPEPQWFIQACRINSISQTIHRTILTMRVPPVSSVPFASLAWSVYSPEYNQCNVSQRVYIATATPPPSTHQRTHRAWGPAGRRSRALPGPGPAAWPAAARSPGPRGPCGAGSARWEVRSPGEKRTDTYHECVSKVLQIRDMYKSFSHPVIYPICRFSVGQRANGEQNTEHLFCFSQ